MKISFILICVFFIWPTVANGQSIEFDVTKLKPSSFSDPKVINGLIFEDNNETYKVVNTDNRKGLLIKKDGRWLQHGKLFIFYKGRLTEMTTYRFGKRNGLHESYFKNGSIEFRYSYLNGQRNGKFYQYRENESLVEESEYKNGVLHGIQINYHPNGRKEFVKHYVEGKRHGEVLQYNSRGELVNRTLYNMGTIVKN